MRASFAIAAMLILLIGLQLFKSESNVSESNIVESYIVETPLKDKTTVASTNILIPAENQTLANVALGPMAVIFENTAEVLGDKEDPLPSLSDSKASD